MWWVSGLFPWGKAAGAWRWKTIQSMAEVKERVELYLHSLFGNSWPLIGWTLPFLHIIYNICVKTSQKQRVIQRKLSGKGERDEQKRRITKGEIRLLLINYTICRRYQRFWQLFDVSLPRGNTKRDAIILEKDN